MPDTSPQEPSPIVGEGSTAATNRTAAEVAAIFCAAAGHASEQRTVDADRSRVLEFLERLQRFVRGGGVRMWDGVDEHQAHADLQYAADAVARFPGPGGPLFSEDVGLFVQVAGEQQKQYVRFEITTGGRIVLRALALEGQPRVVDVDLVTATERLLRYPL